MKTVNMQSTGWEKICAILITNEELIPKNIETSYRLVSKLSNYYIINYVKSNYI